MADFLLRVTTPSSLLRVELPRNATMDALYTQIADSLATTKSNIALSFDGRTWTSFPATTPLAAIPQLGEEGARVKARPIDAAVSVASLGSVTEIEQPTRARCDHGPGQRCLKCAGPPSASSEELQKVTAQCAHGPNTKCNNCLTVDQNVKHLSFDEYLYRNYARCKTHSAGQRCTNCLIDLHYDYTPKPCSNHEPYPRGMCSSCMPPAIVLRRQPYRHVDYAQFHNGAELQEIIRFWMKSQRQRAGYLYGYYCEDPIYERGVRAIVEALYEPPQTSEVTGTTLHEDPFGGHVQKIAETLGLERIGWFFTTLARDSFLTAKELFTAAAFQHEFQVMHPCGINVSKQLTLVLRADEAGGVTPEVYMVSDQGQSLVAGAIVEPASRKHLRVRSAPATGYAPRFLYMGKNVEEVEPDFFIVNVANGQPRSNRFNLLASDGFPPANRPEPQRFDTLREYLRKNRATDAQKYANFHLLIYLAKVVDLSTALTIAECIREGKAIPLSIDATINQKFA